MSVAKGLSVICLAFPVNIFNTKQVFDRFPDMRVPKVLLLPLDIRIFGPKTSKFGQKLAFLVILGQILAFLIHLVLCPTQAQCKIGASVVF